MAKSTLPASRATDAQGNRRDLTQVEGNPAADLHAAYTRLMTITCPDALRTAALEIVEYRLAEGGISATNAAKFRRTVSGLTDLGRLQGFLTNWVLKAAGLGVVYTGAR